MKTQLAQEIENLLDKAVSPEVALLFKENLEGGKLTRDENQTHHFCAYFAGCDYKNKLVFIGHHKKSGLWLFNGGHIDEGEILSEAVKREIDEEWGLDIKDLNVSEPSLLTIAEINNPTKQTCRLHLDIWHFVNAEKDYFNPNQEKLAEEFHLTEWMDIEKARKVVTDKGALQALNYIEANCF